MPGTTGEIHNVFYFTYYLFAKIPVHSYVEPTDVIIMADADAFIVSKPKQGRPQ